MRILIFVSTVVFALGCSKKSEGEAEPAAKVSDKAEVKKATPKPPRAPANASCMSVMATKLIADAKSDLKMTLGGEPFAVALKGSTAYERNPVWNAGAAPSACGITSPEGIMAVVQLELDGKPRVRLQWLNVAAGSHDVAKVSVVGMVALDGDDSARALQFTAGKLSIGPDPLVPGPVKIKFKDASGKVVGTDKAFTLAGTISGTFAAR